MSSFSRTCVALAGAALIVAGVSADQAAPAPAAAPARPRLLAPVRGMAEILFVNPVSIRKGTNIVTTIRIQNNAGGPIAGFKADEFWYAKNGDPVTGGTYRHPRPLMPGEVIDVVITTPSAKDMDRNNYKFTHANGDIKTTKVGKIAPPAK